MYRDLNNALQNKAHSLIVSPDWVIIATNALISDGNEPYPTCM